jgi:hypothetical protein
VTSPFFKKTPIGGLINAAAMVMMQDYGNIFADLYPGYS